MCDLYLSALSEPEITRASKDIINNLLLIVGNIAALCNGKTAKMCITFILIQIKLYSPYMAKPVIVSGIQPSGKLHIGNYLGALKNFIEFQNSGDYDCYFFIADLHSLTEEFDPKEKSAQVRGLASSFLAAGLDPQKSTLFIQSHVPAHSELAFIFNTITPMGELSRMTQFKDKSESGNINAGLFTYPILMAADILLYDAKFVPVGDDQDQHLELTRTIARKFNARFGKTFPEPVGKHTEISRLMSLDDPTKKMSKSRPAGCLFISDEPKVIEKKMMSAVTDSGNEIRFDTKEKPGISNLLLIASTLTGKEMKKLENEFHGDSYSVFKKKMATLVADYFAPFREKELELLKHPEQITDAFEKGAERANDVATKKLAEVKAKIGLI